MTLNKVRHTIVIMTAIITGSLIASQETDISPDVQAFIQTMKDEGSRYYSKRNLPRLIAILDLIAPILDVLQDERSILFNGNYQIGAYFKEAILNAVLDDRNTFFINPLDEKFTKFTKFELPATVQPLSSDAQIALNNVKQHKYIYKTFFELLIWAGAALEGADFNRILPLLANLAVFLFDNTSSLTQFVNDVESYVNEDAESNINEKILKNNLMHILTDASIRIYCYAHNERSKAFKNASRFQKVRMYTMSIFKNPVPIDTIVFCMRQWHLFEKKQRNNLGLTSYLGNANQNLKEKLQKWLSKQDKKATDALADYIVIMATESRSKRMLQKAKLLSAIAGVYLLSWPALVETGPRTARDAREAATFYLVGAGFLFALEKGIIQAGVAKVKTYYEAGKTRAAAIGSRARQYLEAQRERARTYYERLKSRLRPSKPETFSLEY